MSQQKYPIGIQSFPSIIEEGYTYVDKTHFIAQLIKEGKYIFLSRPRRFGKSLLLSTIHTYFDGRRDLFKGLAIDSMDMEWTPKPVLHFDFNSGLYDQSDGLEEKIDDTLSYYENQYGLNLHAERNVVTRFGNLIRNIHNKTGKKVAILVDEYDKPLLGLEVNAEQFEKNQILLKGFFSNLKSMDGYIQFAILTGVARFSRVSIFSDLNNLRDISMYDRYQEICGLTEEELTTHFQNGIMELAENREESYEKTLECLRGFYDGYLFSHKGRRLYNPFSVMMALDSKEIKSYWFETGTPTFLAKWVKKNGIYPRELNEVMATDEDLVCVGFDSMNPVPLMFQTGYLTIESYDRESQFYTLCFPNREVKTGFFNNLLPLYAPATAQRGNPFDFTLFKRDLIKGHIEDFMQRLAILLKNLPGEDHCESTYRAITYLLAVLCGTDTISEHHGYKGRSDIEVVAGNYVYIFEFKYNKSVGEAMEQIYSRDYAGRYGIDPRTVYIIGANYNETKDKRGLEYEIDMLRNA
ncbi:MAG: ATP-binding protein [Muribaculaceae bacterium]|nr:ATP-binding protein [Muribaculaceae bacterium]